MSDQAKSITELVTAARTTLKSITQDPAVGDADKRAAFETYEDLLLLIGGEAMKDYESRTAALAGLIAELTAFTKSVKVKNPITDKLNALTAIADKAVDLFKVEKKAAKDG